MRFIIPVFSYPGYCNTAILHFVSSSLSREVYTAGF